MALFLKDIRVREVAMKAPILSKLRPNVSRQESSVLNKDTRGTIIFLQHNKHVHLENPQSRSTNM